MTTQTCSKCGAVYEVREVKVAFRDRDRFDCSCGETLANWNGSRYPTFSLIKPGKATDDREA
jgi:hypothetical protein